MADESTEQTAELKILEQLNALEPNRRQRALRKIIAAALGSIPWVGGFVAAMIAFREEGGQLKIDSLQREWLQEHEVRMRALGTELSTLLNRFTSFGDEIEKRLESEEYLAIIRKGFRLWDQADTAQKRTYVGRLLVNAGATEVCDDDLVRLFLDWLERYHETHFQVIREIFQRPGCTRRDIWARIHGSSPREDSAEADLFKLLIRDLSTGGIIRQHREINYAGEYVKKQTTRTTSGTGVKVMKSAFDDQEAYELTQLGKQFVHYVFSEVVQRLGDNAAA